MKTQRAVSFDESSMESCSLTTATLSNLQDDHYHHRLSSNGCGGATTASTTTITSSSCSSSCANESCESLRETRVAPDGAARDSSVGPINGCVVGQEVTSLEEAKGVIAALRARQRAQAHQMLAWRRTLKLQEELVARLTREKAEQLRSLSSQLLLFESRLCRKQKEIEASLAQREAIILRQQKVIRQLQSKLRLASEYGGQQSGKAGQAVRDSPPCDALDRLDSLGDSDSAVVLEEAFLDDPAPPRFRSNITDVTVIRSVSDAVEPANNKYCSSQRRCNGFLRRPEVLETVYSVEEDGDTDNRADNDEVEADEEDNNDEASDVAGRGVKGTRHSSIGSDPGSKPRLRELYGSFERLAQQEVDADDRHVERMQTTPSMASSQRNSRDESQQAQVTYNRVMSNHRSVTKPKDVKYKRINKAKSKSLEELRGRLRNWVEKGNKIAISLDQSYA